MFKLKTLMLASAATLFALAANAQITERTIRIGTGNVATHPIGQAMTKLSETVAAKSGGKLKISTFFGGQLGGDAQVVAAAQGGTVDMYIMNTGSLQTIQKELAVVDLPFLFANAKEADAVVDGAVGKKLHKLLEDKGLIGLGYWELGYRNVTNNTRPITKLEDFKGLKLRVIGAPLFIDTFNALGANPTPMPWPEVYAALEQKVVDGQENPYATILGAKFPEVQKFVSATNHIYNPQSVLYSKKLWDGLSADEKKIIGDAVTEITTFQRELSRKASGEALEALKTQKMQANDIAPAEMEKIRAAVKPVVEKYAANVGPEIWGEVQAAIASVRK
jgi:TRAP-type transport system periplasmic protein